MKKLTGNVIALFIIGLIIYDIVVFILHGQEATVSHLIITDWSRNYPVFTFAVGFIMGHFFWRLRPKRSID